MFLSYRNKYILKIRKLKPLLLKKSIKNTQIDNLTSVKKNSWIVRKSKSNIIKSFYDGDAILHPTFTYIFRGPISGPLDSKKLVFFIENGL